MNAPARERFFELLRTAVRDGTLVKLTLGKYRGPDATLRNVFIRPVTLKSGLHVAFVWRHATRDVTKNLAAEEALAEIERWVGGAGPTSAETGGEIEPGERGSTAESPGVFLDAHLFTTTLHAQFESQPDGRSRIKVSSTEASRGESAPAARAGSPHDRQKQRLIPADAPWLRALGVTNERGQPREAMADKFRQIEKFAELLSHLIAEAFPETQPTSASSARGALQVADMGSGKGYLTFAVADLLGARAVVRGIEVRPALVKLCNRVAHDTGFGERLTFRAGNIADTSLEHCDVLIALHACDTATDDALARGISAGARLLVVAPCCQKEVRPQLKAPPVLTDALRHGIFQERQAEFATDALRAQLLEWAGYRTKVFEFISTEHTAKNLMIAAIKTATRDATKADTAQRIREFAAFYGIHTQRLAQHLGFALGEIPHFIPEQ
jgi:hypothetical protein